MLIATTAKNLFFRFRNVYFGLFLLLSGCSKDIATTLEEPSSTGTWTINGKTYQAKSNKVTGKSVVWFDILNGQLNPQSPANTISITFIKALPANAGQFNIGILASDTSSDLPNSAAIVAMKNAHSQDEISFTSPAIVNSVLSSGKIEERGSKRYLSLPEMKVYQLGKNSSDYVDSTILTINGLEY